MSRFHRIKSTGKWIHRFMKLLYSLWNIKGLSWSLVSDTINYYRSININASLSTNYSIYIEYYSKCYLNHNYRKKQASLLKKWTIIGCFQKLFMVFQLYAFEISMIFLRIIFCIDLKFIDGYYILEEWLFYSFTNFFCVDKQLYGVIGLFVHFFELWREF